MIQTLFLALLIVSLLAGFFTFTPQSKLQNPVKFVMDKSGYSSEDILNHQETQQINLSVDKGIKRIRSHIEELTVRQEGIADAIKNEKQLLQDENKDAQDILLSAKGQGADILQLQSLITQMQDKEKLLVDHGRDIVLLNDQLSQKRELLATQIGLGHIGTQGSVDELRQRYQDIQTQASGLFDKAAAYNQQVSDQMGQIHEGLRDAVKKDLCNEGGEPQSANSSTDCASRILDKEHDNMQKLADSEQASKDLMEDAKQKLAASQDVTNDIMQHSQDIIDEENQKQQDQQMMMQQRLQDEQQRIQDQQNR